MINAPKMPRREYPYTPTQQAANGALQIYVLGRGKGDSQHMLFGLSVLRNATEAQVHAAIAFVQTSLRMTLPEIEGMLAR